MKLVARPLCYVLIFCFVFHCDGFSALAQARASESGARRESPRSDPGWPPPPLFVIRAAAEADEATTCLHHVHALLRKWGSADRPFSETASKGPNGALSRSRLTVEWDFDGRMVAATTPTASLEFRYDADGIRWRKSVNGVATVHVTDKNRDFAQVLEERDAAGAIDVLYVYGDDLISQERATTGLRFYHVDGQMSTRQLTDGGASVTDTYTFDAFGVTLAQTGSVPNQNLYAGEQFDPHLGLYYLRARFLSHTTGRFLSLDPASGTESDPVSLHKYLYAGALPITNIDPSGEAIGTLMDIFVTTVLIGILVGFMLPALSPPKRVGRNMGECFDLGMQEYLPGLIAAGGGVAAGGPYAHFAGNTAAFLEAREIHDREVFRELRNIYGAARLQGREFYTPQQLPLAARQQAATLWDIGRRMLAGERFMKLVWAQRLEERPAAVPPAAVRTARG